MKFVPRREKVRKGFSSPDGIALLAKATGWERDDETSQHSQIAFKSGGSADYQRPFLPGHGNFISPSRKKRDK